jgi:hypothetical protein
MTIMTRLYQPDLSKILTAHSFGTAKKTDLPFVLARHRRSRSRHQTGLIVIGAYTHGDYWQFLFGGVTRYVMEHAAIPILFAH